MTYDIVIIGAGSAGCVLAARLSQDPARSVLLLEAGPDYPAALPADIADGRRLAASHDWGLRSEPGPDRHDLAVPRGRLVGGSSAVNACFALRGHPADYDAWASPGDPEWTFKQVLPAFRAIEADHDFGDAAWHGRTGPLPIQRYAELTPLHRVFLEAANAAGYPHCDDHNAPGATGAGRLPTNCRDGRRISSAIAFLNPARPRPNLQIRPDVLVDRLEVSRGRAVAVVLADGERIPAGTIVLAAGTYGSPAVLLRSGIGPADELAALGVAPLADLPAVGRGLIDHPAASIDVVAPADWPAMPVFQSVVTTHSASADPTGPPDIQLFAAGTFPSPDGNVAAIIAAVLKPRSRGSVRLRGIDPADPPRIDLGHLREEADVATLVEGMHRARRLLATRPFAEIAGGILAPEPTAWAADATLARWLRHNVWTYHHPVGTCRMGIDPTQAVVDPRGRLYGVDGVVVADASVMPDIPSANTNLPTMMLAWRLAEAI
jgi:choline dehydrogenase